MFANFDQSYQLGSKMKTNSPLLFRHDVIYTNTVIWLDSLWMAKKRILIVNLLMPHPQTPFIPGVRFHH